MLKQSFPPIISQNANILILGSLPGDLSISKNEYYAHPQNRFWKVLFALFEKPYSTDYSEKVQLLHDQKIALWDVCASAHRPGSMDIDITNVIPNDINYLLLQNTTIKTIIFNGQKAQKLFDKHFDKQQNIKYITLPSTSPANAQFSIDKLLVHWRIIQHPIVEK